MDTLAHPLDSMIVKHLPTLCAPKFGTRFPCPEGTRRFLMTSEGLKIEARTPWGHVVMPLWNSPIALPYGNVRERIELFNGPIPADLIEAALARARRALPNEWAGWIATDKDGYTLIDAPAAFATPESIKFDTIPLSLGEGVVVDIHSHGRFPAFFSGADNTDDQGGTKFSLVFGEAHKPSPSIARRLCVEGLFFNEIPPITAERRQPSDTTCRTTS